MPLIPGHDLGQIGLLSQLLLPPVLSPLLLIALIVILVQNTDQQGFNLGRRVLLSSSPKDVEIESKDAGKLTFAFAI